MEYSSLQTRRTATGTHMPYGITVLPATRQRWHSCLCASQLRLVLDLPTPEGWKA